MDGRKHVFHACRYFPSSQRSITITTSTFVFQVNRVRQFDSSNTCFVREPWRWATDVKCPSTSHQPTESRQSSKLQWRRASILSSSSQCSSHTHLVIYHYHISDIQPLLLDQYQLFITFRYRWLRYIGVCVTVVFHASKQ